MNEEPLSPAEIQSLLGGGLDPVDSAPLVPAIEPARASEPRGAAVSFDPRALAGLKRIHDSFCQRLAPELSTLLRSSVRVRLVSVDATRWGEFAGGLPAPTCLSVLMIEPLGADVALHISPAILFPLIDRMLGGSGRLSGPLPRRPLTEIELRLARRIVQTAVGALQPAWREIVPLVLRGERIESEADRAAIAAPAEPVIVITCEITLDESRGPVHLCLPVRGIEAHVRRLAAAGIGDGTAGRSEMDATADGALVELTALLAETTMTPEELLDLQPGDIITTPQSAEDPVLVTVEGLPKFHGRVGRHQGRLAVRIEERIAKGTEPAE